MNINDLYFANISMITKKEYRRNGETAYYHEAIRQTIVKPTKSNRYIDLFENNTNFNVTILSHFP